MLGTTWKLFIWTEDIPADLFSWLEELFFGSFTVDSDSFKDIHREKAPQN